MAIITVTTTADSGAGSLRAAIAAANDGDAIQFDATVFPTGTTTAILLASQLLITKTLVIVGDGRVELDGQNATGCVSVYSTGNATLLGLSFVNGATSNGGGLTVRDTAQATVEGCSISSCAATTNGGGLYARDTARVTLNDCTITSCTATNGGAIYATQKSVVTLAGGSYGPQIYATSTSSLTLSGLTTTALYIGASVSFTVAAGVVIVDALMIANSATATLSDGAALTITTSATNSAATYTTSGRAYLATAVGIDLSAATITNVVSCAYGAGLTSFDIDADGAYWTAADDTVAILIEEKSGGDWTTLDAAATGGEYAATFAIGTIARAFDGTRFWVAEISAYWQVASFVVANNGGGGAGDSAACWVVENKTITPNISGV